MLCKGASSTIFRSLVWLDQGLNLGLMDHWRRLYSWAKGPLKEYEYVNILIERGNVYRRWKLHRRSKLNSRTRLIRFIFALMSLGKVLIHFPSTSCYEQTGIFKFCDADRLRKGKLWNKSHGTPLKIISHPLHNGELDKYIWIRRIGSGVCERKWWYIVEPIPIRHIVCGVFI